MATQQTTPAVFQSIEDWPGNPGWWRYSKPRVVRATPEQLERWDTSFDHRYYICRSMASARHSCGQDRAEWRRKYRGFSTPLL